MKTTKQECCQCREMFDPEEMDSRPDEDGDPICCDCYHAEYEFTCCCCCEYGDVKDQHNLLVVFEEVSKVQPGIYKITQFPYHTHAMIGHGWLHPESLERIADVGPRMDGNGYQCGHLCKGCQDNVLAQFAAKCVVCKTESASCLRVKLGSWKDFKGNKYRWTPPKVVCAACRHKHRGACKRVERKGSEVVP